jgi:predicted DNA-binding protein (MmcQ/YjbR family)
MMSNSDRIRALALSLPSTFEDSPWGFPVFKVGDNKLFAMMMTDHGGECELTVKLTNDEVRSRCNYRTCGVRVTSVATGA